MKKQASKLAVFALITASAIYGSFFYSNFANAQTIEYINQSATDDSNTDQLDFTLSVSDYYDFLIFECTLYGWYDDVDLDSFNFSNVYDEADAFEYTVRPTVNPGWTQFDIVLPKIIWPNDHIVSINIDEAPANWFCDVLLVDYDDVQAGAVSREWYDTSLPASLSKTFTADGSEDRFFFVKMQQCPSCGDLGITSNFNDIAYTNNNIYHDEYYTMSWEDVDDGGGIGFSATLTGKTGQITGQGLSIELLSVADESVLPIEEYWTQGDYAIPKSINCYNLLEYCDMVFGYDMNAYARALTEEDPKDQEYPAFAWWWPNLTASSSIYSATLRDHIEQGQSLYVNFKFETPTSTTQYTLELEDPNNVEIGSSTSFVIDVNLITTSTQNIMATCLGECDDGLLGEIFCGIKKAVCYFIVPNDESTVYIKASFDQLSHAPPFYLITDIVDEMTDATDQENDMTGIFSIPMIRPTATGSDIYMLPILNASSVPMVLGDENADLFRNTLTWIMYIFAILGITSFLIINLKR